MNWIVIWRKDGGLCHWISINVAFFLSICEFFFFMNKKVKISTITGPRCPEGSRNLRFPNYVTVAQDGSKVVSFTHRPLFNPRKYSWYSFLLEAESTPGPWTRRFNSYLEPKVWFNTKAPRDVEGRTLSRREMGSRVYRNCLTEFRKVLAHNTWPRNC